MLAKLYILLTLSILALEFTAHGEEDRLAGTNGTDYLSNYSGAYRYESNFDSSLADDSVSLSLVIDAGGLFLKSRDIKGFKTSDSESMDEERISSNLSFGVSLNVGLGVNTSSIHTRLMLSRGSLFNEEIESFYTGLSLESHFKLGQYTKIGILAGALHFDDAEWDDDSGDYNMIFSSNPPDTEFEGGTGYLYGVILTIGSDMVRFVCSVSHLKFAYDVIDSRVKPSKTWTASDNKLDMSGTLVHMGVRVEF